MFLDAIGRIPAPESDVDPRPQYHHPRVRDTPTAAFSHQIAESLRLRANEGLPLWLVTEARILHRAEVESHLHTLYLPGCPREMQALRTVASIPLIASGSLVGILNLGERVTGLPYTDDELGILCNLVRQVAISIKTFNLHEEFQSQKTCIENILTHMSSGCDHDWTDEKSVFIITGLWKFLRNRQLR